MENDLPHQTPSLSFTMDTIQTVHSLRDACFYMGGNQALPAPCFVFLYNSVTIGWILFKFGRYLQ